VCKLPRRTNLRAALAPTESKKSVAAKNADPVLAKISALLDEVFEGVEETARKAAAAESKKTEDLSYGEVDFHSFVMLASKLGLENQSSFVDLGSGVGRNVLAAALLYPGARCAGVEILAPLHELAVAALEKLGNALESDKGKALALPRLQQVTLTSGDLTVHDWSSADAVFCNSTLFGADLMGKLETAALKLKGGARIVVFTHALKDESAFELVETFKDVSFYRCAVFLYRRR
jgi:precorrin-6B methylase 2